MEVLQIISMILLIIGVILEGIAIYRMTQSMFIDGDKKRFFIDKIIMLSGLIFITAWCIIKEKFL